MNLLERVVLRTVIVIPVYNDAKFLKECLDCIAEQTILPDCVVVVDNNCTDHSMEIAKQYDFVTIVKESRQGICAAAKTGYDAALNLNADVILRCDADSRPPVDWVEGITAHFRNSCIVAVTGPGDFYGVLSIERWMASIFYMKAYFWSVGLALGQPPLFGSNCAFTAESWRKITAKTHLHDQKLHDDIDLSYHLAPLGQITYDKHLTIPISGRPLRSIKGMFTRFKMGFKSITIHWPEQAPWRNFGNR